MKQLIYVELDCLLDTRIVTLANLLPPIQAVTLVGDQYRNRVIDDFTDLCGISKVEFMEAYAKRDKETLFHARPTEMVTQLREMVLATEKEAIYTPYSEGVDVQVNIYPYHLTVEELDAMSSAVMAFTGVDCRVEVTRFHPEELTPSLLRSSYAALIMYDFNAWLHLHGTALVNDRIPTVTFITPALYAERVPVGEELEMPDKDIKNHFAATEMTFIDSMDLRMQDSRMFSLMDLT